MKLLGQTSGSPGKNLTWRMWQDGLVTWNQHQDPSHWCGGWFQAEWAGAGTGRHVCEPAALSLRICARGHWLGCCGVFQTGPSIAGDESFLVLQEPSYWEKSGEMHPSLWHRFSQGLRGQVVSEVRHQLQIRTQGVGSVRSCHPASQDTVPELGLPSPSLQCRKETPESLHVDWTVKEHR